jgi:sulfide:quinone oxidoreductase
MGSSDRPRSAYRVLIAGGGVAALEAALALRELAEERVQIELLAPETHFWYRPLAVAEPFGLGQVHRLDLVDFAHECRVQASLGALAGVDAEKHVARTRAGYDIEYDALLVACGAQPKVAVPGSFTFRGPADVAAFARLLEKLGWGSQTVVFALAGGMAWPLPLYELALLTAAHLAARHADDVDIQLVTHEEAPLALFGQEASEVVRWLLEERGIVLRTGSYAREFRSGHLELTPEGSIAADHVVALPRLEGVAIDGVPHDGEGFIPTDRFGRVDELPDVYAAGDATSFAVKQGGLAAQQAEAAATAIAARAGAPVDPAPFNPVLRGLLLTGGIPRYLRTELTSPGQPAEIDAVGLWWPPNKIAGRFLAPFLAARHGDLLAAPSGVEALPVDVSLAGEYRFA